MKNATIPIEEEYYKGNLFNLKSRKTKVCNHKWRIIDEYKSFWGGKCYVLQCEYCGIIARK